MSEQELGLYTDEFAGNWLLAFYGFMSLSEIADRALPFDDVNKLGGYHHESGIPYSSAARSIPTRAVGGLELAMKLVVVPRRFASWALRRHSGTDKRTMGAVGEQNWTYQERQAVYDFTMAVRRAVHRMHEDGGLFDPQPVSLSYGVDGDRIALSHTDGLTEGFQITWKGLKKAQEFAQEHPEMKWQTLSPEQDFGAEIWAMTPDWYKDEVKHGRLKL